MPSFTHQLKLISRRLAQTPMFTAVALITIALGIGANTAIFSVIDGILLKPLPYHHPERLVSVWQFAPALDMRNMNMSPSDYFTFREENRTFQEFGMWDASSETVTGLGTPEQAPSIQVTYGVLPALAVKPEIGRWFNATDDLPSSPETVMLAYGYWQRKFGGAASVLGRRIVLDGVAHEITGVMPRDFRFLDEKADLILPFRFDRAKVMLGNFSYRGIARLRPGVTLAQANADVGRMIPMVNTRFQPPPGFSVKLFEKADIRPSLRPLKQDVVGELGKVLWVLMASIGAVLLIACANVANLLLVRAEGRQQELSIRVALGASARQIAGELLLESLALGALGGAAGLGVAYAALRLLVRIAPAYLPRIDGIGIDPASLLFTLAISLAAGLLFGLIPVLKYATPRVADHLRAGGRTLSQSRERHRARNVLVVAQVAMALVLLIGSGLMIRTFQALRHVDPGFTNPAGIQTVRLYVADTQVKDPERVMRMYEEMARKLSEIPGVTSAAFSHSVPADGRNSTDLLYAEDRIYKEGELPPLRRFKFVTPGFFKTMGYRMIAGRDYTWDDIYGRRNVAVISDNLAREMWGSPATALGKRIREGMKDPWREIIGVVGDVYDDGPDQKPRTTVYWPMLMTNFWGNEAFLQRGAVFAIRSSRAGSESLIRQAREAVWSVNAEVPLTLRTAEDIYRGSMARSSFTLVMLAIAGGLALILGVVGIYGVVSYSVSQRTREIGIRITLGAPQAGLIGMVVRHGLMLAAVGVGIGVAAAAPLTRLMSSLLFAVSPLDPLTYCAVSAGLLAAAAAASYAPAHKASTVNPVEALRAE